LGVSESTLRRRRYELGWLSQGNYAIISDERLDEHVRAVLQTTPRIGLRLDERGTPIKGPECSKTKGQRSH
jgi:hypothetical protein